MTLEDSIKDAERKMQKTLDVYETDLAGVRTNRASAGLLVNIKVDYHGQQMPIEHLAQVTTDGQSSLLIQPWDADAIEAICKAIQASELNCNPQVDGGKVRLVLAPLSEERRRELVKMVNKRSEDAKISIRNIRRVEMEALRKLEKSENYSQDEVKRYQKRLQGLTDDFVDKISALTAKKDKDLMSV